MYNAYKYRSVGERFLKCTFFGHSNTSKEIQTKLEEVLVDLIENYNVDTFYVGNQGNFDFIVRKTLKKLKLDYPYINYAVVLAYMPDKKDKLNYEDYSESIYPDGLENTPPKYAISKRNRWMVNKADYVITYVKYTIGGAAKFKEYSEKQGKTVINLVDFKLS